MKAENTKKIKEIKLNVNYVNFIAKLHSSKIEVTEKNKASIQELYAKEVGLRFNNLPRISNRTMRAKLKPVLEAKLKEAKMDLKSFTEITNQVVEVAKAKSRVYA